MDACDVARAGRVGAVSMSQAGARTRGPGPYFGGQLTVALFALALEATWRLEGELSACRAEALRSAEEGPAASTRIARAARPSDAEQS